MTLNRAIRPLAVAGTLLIFGGWAWTGCGGSGAKCGNGKAEAGEQCDDGASLTGACTSQCTWQEFDPDSSGSGSNMYPAVAMNQAGDFVVAWRAADGQMDEDIWVAAYGANGKVTVPAFRVNEQTAGYQQHPMVAIDGQGNFAVVWQIDPMSAGATNENVWMRAFGPDGTPHTGDVQLNTWTGGWQSRPHIAMNEAGALVAVWTSNLQDGDLTGVFARMGDSTGQLAAAEPFQVNTAWDNAEEAPWVGIAADGKFVIAWEAVGQEST